MPSLNLAVCQKSVAAEEVSIAAEEVSIDVEFWFVFFFPSWSWQRQVPSPLLYAHQCLNGANLDPTRKADVGWASPLTFCNYLCMSRPEPFLDNYRGICKCVFTIWQQCNCWLDGWPLWRCRKPPFTLLMWTTRALLAFQKALGQLNSTTWRHPS